jgi:diphthamide biosynthesis methyltransferase
VWSDSRFVSIADAGDALLATAALLSVAILATAHGSVVEVIGGLIIVVAARGLYVYDRRRRRRD